MDDEGTVPMVSGGLSAAGLNRLHEVMAGQVREGRVPGLVLGLRRGGDVHIDAIGSAAAGGSTPMWPDAIFRLTSMTRPVTAVATLLLVQDGRLELDEPIGRLLPELADRPVLRQPDGPLDDTVPASRPVTVRDLLTFRGGFGMILAAAGRVPHPGRRAGTGAAARSGHPRPPPRTARTSGCAGWAACR